MLDFTMADKKVFPFCFYHMTQHWRRRVSKQPHPIICFISIIIIYFTVMWFMYKSVKGNSLQTMHNNLIWNSWKWYWPWSLWLSIYMISFTNTLVITSYESKGFSQGLPVSFVFSWSCGCGPMLTSVGELKHMEFRNGEHAFV